MLKALAQRATLSAADERHLMGLDIILAWQLIGIEDEGSLPTAVRARRDAIVCVEDLKIDEVRSARCVKVVSAAVGRAGRFQSRPRRQWYRNLLVVVS